MSITENDKEKAREIAHQSYVCLARNAADIHLGACDRLAGAIAAAIAAERERPYWVCEQHPDKDWPHGDCAGPGMLRSDALRLIVRYRTALEKITDWERCDSFWDGINIARKALEDS